MSKTDHVRPPKASRPKREDYTQIRQPRPGLRRRNTRQAAILAALKEG